MPDGVEKKNGEKDERIHFGGGGKEETSEQEYDIVPFMAELGAEFGFEKPEVAKEEGEEYGRDIVVDVGESFKEHFGEWREDEQDEGDSCGGCVFVSESKFSAANSYHGNYIYNGE